MTVIPHGEQNRRHTRELLRLKREEPKVINDAGNILPWVTSRGLLAGCHY